MSLHDFENIALQCSQQTYQFALGGCGDPDQHEHFWEILEICTHVGIVSNYTTLGFGITEEQRGFARNIVVQLHLVVFEKV